MRKCGATNKAVLGRLCPGEVARKASRAKAHVEGTKQRQVLLAKKRAAAAGAKKFNKAGKAFMASLEQEFAPAPVAAEEDEE